MPDPTAHAADMTSPAQPETMPSLWWLDPLGFAVKQWNKRAEFYQFWQQAKADHNAFQRQVELTLKPVLSPEGYNDTIDLVVWAADEISRLRVQLQGITEDRDDYVNRLKAAREEAEKLRTELDSALKRGIELQDKCRLIHGVHQGDVWEFKTDGKKYGDLRDGYAAYAGMMLGHMHSPNQEPKPKAKRKPAKKKAKKKGGRK